MSLKNLRSCRRILVVGCGGAGKSTLARRLGPLLGLPLVHLDTEYWQPGWVMTPKDDWLRRLDELLTEPEWIMDGNYGSSFARRLVRADAVIYLDFSRLLCVTRALRRAWEGRGRTRPDMAPGCNEKIDLEFLHWIWTWSEHSRPQIEEPIAAAPPGVVRVVVRDPGELEQQLGELEATA
ncbi:MAG: adenylate kinase [Acidobacteriota bacterium]